MDVLISCGILLVCAVVGFLMRVFQVLDRDYQDGNLILEGWSRTFFGGLVGGVYVLSVAAFCAVLAGVILLLPEYGVPLLPPMTMSGVAWYAVWLWGWETGRLEGKDSAERARRIDSRNDNET